MLGVRCDVDIIKLTASAQSIIAKSMTSYTSLAQHIYPIKITTTWNALPSEVVSSSTVNFFKNSLDKHWAENPQMSELTGSNHRCRAQFKCVQTVVGQRFVPNYWPTCLPSHLHFIILPIAMSNFVSIKL